jgi:hypothetical protein
MSDVKWLKVVHLDHWRWARRSLSVAGGVE